MLLLVLVLLVVVLLMVVLLLMMLVLLLLLLLLEAPSGWSRVTWRRPGAAGAVAPRCACAARAFLPPLHSPRTVPIQSPYSPHTVPPGNLHSPRRFFLLKERGAPFPQS